MTTNNPEVVAWLNDSHHEATLSAHVAEAWRDLKKEVEPLIRLSDYETLQAEYEEGLFQVRQDRDAHFGALMQALEQVDAMKAECEKLRKDADGYRLLDHAAGVLPEGWLIRIDIEREAGWVDLHRPGGGRVAFDFQGTLAEQIAEAIDSAMKGSAAA